MAYPNEFYRPNGLEAYQAQAFNEQIILLILRRKNGRIVTTNDKWGKAKFDDYCPYPWNNNYIFNNMAIKCHGPKSS